MVLVGCGAVPGLCVVVRTQVSDALPRLLVGLAVDFAAEGIKGELLSSKVHVVFEQILVNLRLD